MNTDNDDKKLKEILNNMNSSETSLENFYEMIEKDTGGKLTFSNFKSFLDRNYQTINKLDKIFLLRHISIDPSGRINLCEIFNYFSNILGQTISSPILAFYNIASTIENILKISTVEFIYKFGLSLDDEININDFCLKIANNLKINDITTIIVFKGLDTNKKGKIRVEDFVVVIDSYREDNLKNNLIQEKNINTNEKENSKLLSSLVAFSTLLKSEIESTDLEINDMFPDNGEDSGRSYELFVTIKNKVKAIDSDCLEVALNFFKKEQNKIFKEDIQNFLQLEEGEINKNYVVNYLKSKKKKDNKYNINDTQIYWINKLLTLLDTIGLTPQMGFEMSLNDNKSKEVNLDNFKRKLQKLIPQSRVTAIELNNIADSLDINKNKFLNSDDYIELVELAKNDPKFSMLISADALSKSSNPLINSFIKSSKNFSELPTKGNTKALTALKSDLNDSKKILVEEKLLPTSNSVNVNKENIKIKEEKIIKIESNANSQNENNLIKDFLKDLEVFENGEWSLIELLEDINLPRKGLLPIADLNAVLIKKFSPTISKKKIFQVCIEIDNNKDGFFTYINLISFSLNCLKHRSTKLALKEIARKIEFDHNLATEDYFARKMLQLNNEMNFVNFTQFFYKNFEIEPPIIKKIFQELKSILSNRSNIFVSDVVDLINEYKIENEKYEDKKKSKEQDSNSTLSLLDKKFYEEEMKGFVRILQKGLCAYSINNIHELTKTLDNYISLPFSMSLYQFREVFIKPLVMNYSLGIGTFQLLRKFSKKDDVTISKEDLFNILESYIDPEVTEMDPEVIVFYLENNFSSLNYCFESISYVYNFKGIATYDILKQMTCFYQKINKKILITLLKAIDKDTIGIVTFKNLCDFLIKYSKRNKYSNDLMIKHLCSILDYINVETKEFIFSALKLKKDDRVVQHSDHIEFFVNKLKFHNDQANSLFFHLSHNCPINESYMIDKLIRLINTLRQSNRKASNLVYDNMSQIHAVKSVQTEFTEFLRKLNDQVNLSKTFDALSIGETLNVSIHDLHKVIVNSYKNILELNKNILIRFFKCVDNDKKGFIPYDKFLKIFYSYLNEFQPSILLHCKYLANKIFKEFDGNMKNYLNYKGITPNKFLTQTQFEALFQEECMGNDYLSFNLYETLKEKKGNNLGTISIQSLIEFLSDLVHVGTNSDIYQKGENLSEKECEEIIKSFIIKIESESETNLYFKNIYEKINLKNVNQFGKINSELMKTYLRDFANMQESTAKIFIKYFCKVLNLFDLHKLTEFIQNNSKKSRVNLTSIISKVSGLIPREKTSIEFSKLYNINFMTPLNLTECCKLLNALFKISIYESFFFFNETVTSSNNPLRDDFKLNIDFILQNYSLYSQFANKKEIDSQKSKPDPSTILCLQKVATYLDSMPNKMKVFKDFDKDSNGVLCRDEFLNLLRSFKNSGLNDVQFVKVLNFVDKNGDDSINYYEFVNLINEFQSDKNSANNMIKSSNALSNSTVKKNSEVDPEILKQNYEFNSKNFQNRIEVAIETIIFQIQEEIFNTFHLKNNLENEMMEIDKNNSSFINKDVFFNFIKKRNIMNDQNEEEMEEKLWNFSMDGLNNSMKNKLLLGKLVNYRLFFKNVTNLRFKINLKKDETKLPNQKNSDGKMKMEEKFIPQVNLKKKDKLKEGEDSKILRNLSNKISDSIEWKDNAIVDKTKDLFLKGITIQSQPKEINKTSSNIGKDPKDESNFKDLIEKITNLEYTGYDYTINPDADYFLRPDGTKVITILNNEDAAIKKCEELIDSLKGNELFFDNEFGSQPNDKGMKSKLSIYITGESPKGNIDPNMIEWYRMNQICKDDEPLFISNGVESNDVMQGALGDCWIISAFSVLATKSHLLRGEFKPNILDDGEIDNEEAVMLSTGVYPPIFHCFRKKNLFCFRFYKNFSWRYVIVDDRLPCRKVFSKNDPIKLIYGKCRSENEFWVPLLEKAYAKLHGSYESLISGFIDDGLVDLSGLIARKVNISKDELTSGEKADKLWDLIKQNTSIKFNDEPLKGKDSLSLKSQILTRNNSMIGCSVDAKVVESEVVHNNKKCGILAGHAYSLLDAIEIHKDVSKKGRHKSRLLRIRNPWGYKEWNGKWSDESGEVEKNKEILQKVFDERYHDSQEKVQLDAEDGSFLMCFSDFRKIYTRLFFCIDFPDSYVGLLFRDNWTKDESGGIPINNKTEEMKSWAKNPQYYLKLEKETNIYISLMQFDGRLTNKKFPYADSTLKNCLIISTTKGKNKLNTFDSNKAINISQIRAHRENSVYCLLAKGEYIISACTFKAGDVGEFALELHFEDSLIDNKNNSTIFQNNLKSTYIERLGKTVTAEIKKETSIEEIQDVKERKKVFMYHQFKSMLIDEEKKESSKNLPVASKIKKEKSEEADDWDEY